MRTLITASPALDHPAGLVMEGRQISEVVSLAEARLPRCDEHHAFPMHTICAPFLDVHVHGAYGHDVMEATPEALSAIGGFLSRHGVGRYLATTVTARTETILRSLEGLARRMNDPDAVGGAHPIGIHLEGPFLSHAKRGVHPPEYIEKPSIALFDRFWEAAEGRIRVMTIAPEIEGAPELIAYASRLGVRISLGHSDADTTQTKAGIAAGARSATHTFNAMRALDHRDPGILGTVLDTDELFSEIICDGIHVDPAMVRLFWKAKGPELAILVTDGISATGMPEGEYMLGGFSVVVKDGRCLRAGHLAGSILTLDRAVTNFLTYTRAPLEAVLRLVTRNPAEMLGLSREQAELTAGAEASFNVVDATGGLAAVYLAGERIS